MPKICSSWAWAARATESASMQQGGAQGVDRHAAGKQPECQVLALRAAAHVEHAVIRAQVRVDRGPGHGQGAKGRHCRREDTSAVPPNAGGF